MFGCLLECHNSGMYSSYRFDSIKYVDDGTEDYNYTVDFGDELSVEFRVCLTATSRKKAISKAVSMISSEYKNSAVPSLLSAERTFPTRRTWWENEYENSIFFDRGVASRQEEHLNRMIEEMRMNKNCTWSVQFVN